MGRRIFDTAFADTHPLYVAKVERTGRAVADVDTVICWLTGCSADGLATAIADRRTLRAFFDAAPAPTPHADLVTGVVCGVRVEDVPDPLMRDIRRMGELVDELARGKTLAKVIRTP